MTTLYHFTNRGQLPSILSMGELMMSRNPHISIPGKDFPTLWFSTESGDGQTGSTMPTALNLDGPIQGRFLANRTEFRIAVEIPDDEVQMWEDYADRYNVPKPVTRKLAKWPKRPEWWVALERNVKAPEWIDISQGGAGTWTPLLTFDTEGQATVVGQLDEELDEGSETPEETA